MFAICDEFEFYGYGRVGAALRQQGLVVNQKKIRRLMREHDLQPKIRRRLSSIPARRAFACSTWQSWLGTRPIGRFGRKSSRGSKRVAEARF
ncbi:IS3 family transposase [Ensifer sesbaniae]|uniref:IS3 family transposase n=1 Tax=Ensifer sesbaniae TaxID=1214071 RepID=UPI002001BB71|nr:IS3 family transposase [Ensifer sesbaniae]